MHSPLASVIPVTLAIAGLAASAVAAGPDMHGPRPVFNVTRCNDSGPGSLRRTIELAPENAIIDLRKLSCRRLALTSGELVIPQDDLYIIGHGPLRFAVDAVNQSRIFNHTGRGTLRVSGLKLINGRHEALNASGGCIRSNGSLVLHRSTVAQCAVVGSAPHGRADRQQPSSGYGGAIFARNVHLSNSTVAYNYVAGADNGGGAVYAIERAVAYRSRLTRNAGWFGSGIAAGKEAVIAESTVYGQGGLYPQRFAAFGAIYVPRGNAVIVRSAITDNRTALCSAVCVYGRGPRQGRATILDSTIARNGGAGAIQVSQHAYVANSTIAVNRTSESDQCSPALMAPHLKLVSSIVALNTCGSARTPFDIGWHDVRAVVIGSHNIVQVSNLGLPPDTLRVNPRLQPLRNNGGPTPTMALLDGSLAIDHGLNPESLAYDQRGQGFPRVKNGRTDIGAYER